MKSKSEQLGKAFPEYFSDVADDIEDDEREQGLLDCPNCGREYDEIDYEYQICHCDTTMYHRDKMLSTKK